MHPVNEKRIILPAGAKVIMTNRSTGERLSATLQCGITLGDEVFSVKVAGTSLNNTFSRAEWSIEEREPAVRIWASRDGRMIYRKQRGTPVSVSIGGGDFTVSVGTVAEVEDNPNLFLIFTSEDA